MVGPGDHDFGAGRVVSVNGRPGRPHVEPPDEHRLPHSRVGAENLDQRVLAESARQPRRGLPPECPMRVCRAGFHPPPPAVSQPERGNAAATEWADPQWGSAGRVRRTGRPRWAGRSGNERPGRQRGVRQRGDLGRQRPREFACRHARRALPDAASRKSLQDRAELGRAPARRGHQQPLAVHANRGGQRPRLRLGELDAREEHHHVHVLVGGRVGGQCAARATYPLIPAEMDPRLHLLTGLLERTKCQARLRVGRTRHGEDPEATGGLHQHRPRLLDGSAVVELRADAPRAPSLGKRAQEQRHFLAGGQIHGVDPALGSLEDEMHRLPGVHAQCRDPLGLHATGRIE